MKDSLPPPTLFRDAASGLVVEIAGRGEVSGQAQARALQMMRELEAGEVANPSEGRRVGHYWLRDPQTAPDAATREAITESHQQVFSLSPEPEKDLVLAGIGGSALGMKLVADALLPGRATKGRLICIDNADPQAIADGLARIDLGRCNVAVVSKSGSTAETRDIAAAIRRHFETQGQDFQASAIAISQPDSPLFDQAQDWKARFAIWDWVGGRTSLMSAAGLVPMQLLGLDGQAMLEGAAGVDRWTRPSTPSGTESSAEKTAPNAALRVAQAWFAQRHVGDVQALAILAYRERLGQLGRYLQQLIMESLGKNQTLDASAADEGLIVYGRTGSTDQHSIVQHLTHGRANSMTHFIDSREALTLDVDEARSPLSDRHLCRLYGTRQALLDRQRPFVSLSVPKVDERGIGALVAFFERCVGYYAGLAGINAYDQPGVQAGKKAAQGFEEQLLALDKLLGSSWQSASALATHLQIDATIAWRFASQLVARGRAETKTNPEDEQNPQADLFRAL